MTLSQEKQSRHKYPFKKHHILNGLLLISIAALAPVALAAIFQAEDYTSAFDTTSGNIGTVYRSGDVDIQATTDTGGGYNVGWIAKSEWLAFNNLLIPTTGEYTLKARVASPSGGSMSLDLNGGVTKLADLSVPNTGDWQNWRTISRTVKINAGTHRLGVYAAMGEWNLNWIEVTPCSGTECSTASAGIPGRIEAEQYTSFFDTSAGNSGGALRTDNVDIELAADSGGGYNVGWITPGEYLRYKVKVQTAGRYRVTARVSSPDSDKYFRLKLNDNVIGGQINVPRSGGWQNWTNASIEVQLSAGEHLLDAWFDTGSFNLNYIDFEFLDDGPIPGDETFGVMTYNVRTTPAGDEGERYWENRKAELVRAIQTQKPAIIGLQEATGVQHDYIKAALGQTWASSPQRQILYRNDLFEVIEGGIIELVADVWGRRTSEWIQVRRKADGKQLVFLNNHWGVDNAAQQGSATILRDRLSEVNQNWNLPTVLLGDLNAAPGSGPINTIVNDTPLTSYFNGPTFNGWNTTAGVQLDYVLGNKLNLVGCVVITYREGSLPPSDHFPIFCEMKFQ